MKRPLGLLAAAFLLLAGSASAQTTLRIGLAEDPDILDPTLARTFVGRIVFSAICDKLFDLDEKLNIVPQLATAYEWAGDNKSLLIRLRPGVTFHDGEKFDAEAVRFNIDRHKNLPGSTRRTELTQVASVDVVDPLTVKLNLSAPFAPLLAQLTDRSGMMVSPKAAQAAGDKFGSKPVCAGPFKFVERVAQDRIVLERFADYWNKDSNPFRPHRLSADRRRLGAPRQPACGAARLHRAPGAVRRARAEEATAASRSRGSSRSATRASPSMSARATSRRRTRSAAMRACARPSSCRSTATRSSRWRWTARRRPATSGSRRATRSMRRAARSRSATWRRPGRCSREAGVANPAVTLMTPTTSDAQRVAQVVQAMAKEAGFDIKIQSTEFASSIGARRQGADGGLRAGVERPRRPGRQFPAILHLQLAEQLCRATARRRRTS